MTMITIFFRSVFLAAKSVLEFDISSIEIGAIIVAIGLCLQNLVGGWDYPFAMFLGFIILDYKYLPVNAFTIETLSPKVKQDLTKQLIYEYALQLKFENAKTENQFCIPYFYEDFDYIGDDLASEQINPEIRDNYVKVFKVNFMKLQGIYLEN